MDKLLPASLASLKCYKLFVLVLLGCDPRLGLEVCEMMRVFYLFISPNECILPRYLEEENSCIELLHLHRFLCVALSIFVFCQWLHSDFQVQQATSLVKPVLWTKMGEDIFFKFTNVFHTTTDLSS